MELVPKAAAVPSQASTVSSHAEVLAGESSANKVNCGKVVSTDRSDIGEGLASEVTPDDGETVLVFLNVPGDLCAGASEAKAESLNAREEAANG